MLVNFVERNSQKTWFALAVAFLMSVLTVALPILVAGFRQTADMQSHLQFAEAFRTEMDRGVLYPSWTLDNLGFGSVGIRFYPPVTPFLSAILHLASGNWHFAFSLSMFFWMLVGCLGMYLFVREWSSATYGIIAGILYSIVPYHFAQVYRFFLYAEFAGIALVPFCFLYATRICRRGRWGDVVPLAVSISLLTLTHIPLALMMAFSLLVYVPIALDWCRWKKVSLQLISSGLLVLSATAFYWVRIVKELSWVAHSDPKYTVAAYERGPMLFPYLLVNYDYNYEYPILRHLDIVTVLTIVLLLPSLAFVFARRKSIPSMSIRVLAAVGVTALFGIFMFSKPSEMLWYVVGILQRLQYPWRWLSVVSALAVVSISLSLFLLVEAGRITKRTSMYVAVLLIVGFAIVDIKQIHGTPFRILEAHFNEVAVELESEPVAVHWWPMWARAEAFNSRELVTSAKGRSVDIGTWTSNERGFTIGQGDSENIRVATFYYPHWRAMVNGVEVEVQKDEDGVILLPIGRELSQVELSFEEPLLNRSAGWLSALTWIFFLGIFASRFVPFRRQLYAAKK